MTVSGWAIFATVVVLVLILPSMALRAQRAEANSTRALVHKFQEQTDERLAKVENFTSSRIGEVEREMDAFWHAIVVPASSVLRLPHAGDAKRAQLLDKLVDETLSVRDATDLASMLGSIQEDPLARGSQRIAAGVVRGYLSVTYL